MVCDRPSDVHLRGWTQRQPWTDARPLIRYVRVVDWSSVRWTGFDRSTRGRSTLVVAVVFIAVGLLTSCGQDISTIGALMRRASRAPSAAHGRHGGRDRARRSRSSTSTAVRRSSSALGILVHLLVGWPEGTLPLAACSSPTRSGRGAHCARRLAGLVLISATIVVLRLSGSPGLDDVSGCSASSATSRPFGRSPSRCAIRAAGPARGRRGGRARRRPNARASRRVLAEERLRIAQELHDVVAHSMSVIAVQAGVGAHVLDDRPEEARRARGDLRHVAGDARRAAPPARCAARTATATVARAGARAGRPAASSTTSGRRCPSTCHVEGSPQPVPAGVELSAYRIVQEALTNVIKHAGARRRST